jgi:hypothetical protein
MAVIETRKLRIGVTEVTVAVQPRSFGNGESTVECVVTKVG